MSAAFEVGKQLYSCNFFPLCPPAFVGKINLPNIALTGFQVSKLFVMLLGLARLKPFRIINLENHSGESHPLSFHFRHPPACLGKLCQFRHDIKHWTLYAFCKQIFLTKYTISE